MEIRLWNVRVNGDHIRVGNPPTPIEDLTVEEARRLAAELANAAADAEAACAKKIRP